MKTAEELVLAYMRMIGVTEEVIQNPTPLDVEHRNESKNFFRRIQLDAERSGYERGVREAAAKALPTNIDMAEHEDELCATYYERGRNDASEAILSMLDKRKQNDTDATS